MSSTALRSLCLLAAMTWLFGSATLAGAAGTLVLPLKTTGVESSIAEVARDILAQELAARGS